MELKFLFVAADEVVDIGSNRTFMELKLSYAKVLKAKKTF